MPGQGPRTPLGPQNHRAGVVGSTHTHQTAGVRQERMKSLTTSSPAPWERGNYAGRVPGGQWSLTLMMGGAMARYLSPL